MFTTLAKLWTSNRNRKPTPIRNRLAKRKTQLLAELLEDRCVPSITPFVQTNLSDYPPGGNVLISGGGFTPGEVVQFQVVNVTHPGDGYTAWQVPDAGDGSVQTSWTVPTFPPGDSIGATFTVTAAGLTDGEVATTSFTDQPAEFTSPTVIAPAGDSQGDVVAGVSQPAYMVATFEITAAYLALNTPSFGPTGVTATVDFGETSMGGSPAIAIAGSTISYLGTDPFDGGNSVYSVTLPSSFTFTQAYQSQYMEVSLSDQANPATVTSPSVGYTPFEVYDSISGTKFQDVDGSGLSPTNTAYSTPPVTINLYNGGSTPIAYDNVSYSGGALITSATTDDLGNYSFTDLDVGTYTVSEQVPGGWTQTAPAAPGSYTVTVATGSTPSTGDNFADFQKVDTTLITTASFSAGTGTVVGTAIPEDSAALSGGYDVSGGSITFTLTDPNGDTVASATQTVPVTGDGTYVTTNSIAATEIGTYTWSASYSGDTLNNGAPDQGGTGEQVTTIAATPTLNTTASFSAGTGTVVGTAIPEDSAALSGGYDVSGGSITFTLTDPNGDTVASATQTVPVTGDGTYVTTNTIAATEVGTYTWAASYSGDTLNNGAPDQGGTGEQVTTIAASPTLNTTASFSAGTGTVVGTAIPEDSAALSGGYDVSGGSITFTLTDPNGDTVASATQTVPVTGDGTYVTTNTIAATEIGTYTWSASYSGDTLNNGAPDQGGTGEQVTTIAASPTLTTQATETGGDVVGTAILSDSATLAGGYLPGGTISFTLTGPSGPVALPLSDQSVTVSAGAATTPVGVTATAVGIYTWSATYSGDPNNNPASEPDTSTELANESLTTIAASPTLTTQATETGGDVVGTAVLTDTATLAGGYLPGGTISFTLTGPSGPVALPLSDQSVTVSAGAASTPVGVTATAVGIYTWSATYSGDPNNNPASEPDTSTELANESLTTIAASPTLTTQATETGGDVVGTAVLTDTATLAGGYLPGGTISFTLTGPSGPVALPLSDQSVTVSAGAATTPVGVTATAVGIYTWSATYSGDPNNNPASEPDTSTELANESLTVVAGGVSLTSTAFFKSGSSCGGSGSWSGGKWNCGCYSFCCTGTSGSGSDVVGTAIPEDAAVLSGFSSPTGKITFTLTGPSGHVVETLTDIVKGNGTYVTNGAVVATLVGTYQWSAVYSGDTHNSSAHDQGGTAEQDVVVAASPSLYTRAWFKGSGKCGSSGSIVSYPIPCSGSSHVNVAIPCSGSNVVGIVIPQDSAVLSGGYDETGNIVFTLTAPNGAVVYTQTIKASGNKTYTTSNTAVATQVGTYTWSVTFAGDGLNNPAHDQGGAREQLTVVKASPTLCTAAYFKGSGCTANVMGTAIPEDAAILSGGYSETGNITFKLMAPDGTVAYTQTIAASGNKTYETSNTAVATQVGTYTWVVTFAGDGLNKAVADPGGCKERLAVVKAITIGGCVCQDNNGKGFANDSTYTGPGVTICLYLNGQMVDSTTADSKGNYSFNGLCGTGVYTVCEQVPSGWKQTAVCGTTVLATSIGQTFAGCNFADYK